MRKTILLAFKEAAMANNLFATRRLRFSTRLTFFAALFSVLTLPLNAIAIEPNQTICIDTWYATVCADDNSSTYTETVNVSIGSSDFGGALISNDSGDTIDVSANSWTDSGSGAVVAILNIDTLLGNVNSTQSVGLLGVYSTCQTSDATTCQAAVKAFFPQLSEDDVKKSSTWWHGCQHATDSTSKSFTGLAGPLGYAIGAETKGGSNATITAIVTHHLGGGKTQSHKICGQQATGKLTAGNYTNQVIGHIDLNLTSPDGGTISNKIVTVWSPVAHGTFNVDTGGTIRFTGTASSAKCITIPNPQKTIPTPIQ